MLQLITIKKNLLIWFFLPPDLLQSENRMLLPLPMPIQAQPVVLKLILKQIYLSHKGNIYEWLFDIF